MFVLCPACLLKSSERNLTPIWKPGWIFFKRLQNKIMCWTIGSSVPEQLLHLQLFKLILRRMSFQNIKPWCFIHQKRMYQSVPTDWLSRLPFISTCVRKEYYEAVLLMKGVGHLVIPVLEGDKSSKAEEWLLDIIIRSMDFERGEEFWYRRLSGNIVL